MALLEIKNLTFSYEGSDIKAIDNVDFSLDEGEFCLVCGKSGCGKTTLLKLIKKQLAPYGNLSGSIAFKLKPEKTENEFEKPEKIGFIMQNPDSQIITDSVWQEMSFGLENMGLDSDAIRRRTAETASYFGIEKWFHKKTAELSGGQKQLLNLAAVTAMNPELLILDEPTAQLDPISAENFINVLKKLNGELGVTVLLAEHNLEDVLPLADKVLLLENGKQEYFGNKNGFVSYLNNENHPLYDALPSAARIFGGFKTEEKCPLSVKEGRKVLFNNFTNKVAKIEEPPYEHKKEKAVELKSVFFRYEKNLPDVLNNASLEIYKGEHFCLLGGNGCGKTSCLNVISGVLKPYSGKVIIDGKKISEYKSNSLYLSNVAVLPQNPELLFVHNSVFEDLKEIAEFNGIKGEEIIKKIDEISEKLMIKHLLSRHPYDLSGGELQKAALAKLLLSDPKILLLDEPTKAVDVSAKKYISGIIKNLNSSGVTVITVTHDIEFAAENSDRCGLVFDGQIISVNTSQRFFSENSLYTTAASRISRGYYKNAVLCRQVRELCLKNQKGGKTV